MAQITQMETSSIRAFRSFRKFFHLRPSAPSADNPFPRQLALAALLLLTSPAARAADPVGRITEVAGTAQWKRADTWETAVTSGNLFAGDRLKTGAASRLVFELAPSNRITLEPDTEVVIERHELPADGRADTLLTLVTGGIRGTAAAAYESDSASFLVASPTAKVRVLGGEFAIEYSDRNGVTDVFGVRGRMNVHSTLDPTGAAVLVTANQAARVKQGASPEPAYRTDWILFDRPPGAPLEYSTSRQFESAIWLANPVLSGNARVPLEAFKLPVPGGGLPGNSVDSGNDTGAVLGQPPAALTGPGRLRVMVE